MTRREHAASLRKAAEVCRERGNIEGARSLTIMADRNERSADLADAAVGRLLEVFK